MGQKVEFRHNVQTVKEIGQKIAFGRKRKCRKNRLSWNSSKRHKVKNWQKRRRFIKRRKRKRNHIRKKSQEKAVPDESIKNNAITVYKGIVMVSDLIGR